MKYSDIFSFIINIMYSLMKQNFGFNSGKNPNPSKRPVIKSYKQQPFTR